MIKGVVQKIIKNPQYGLTSFTLKGQDGFYSLGKDVPTFKEGDSIQFDTNQQGKYTYARNIAPWSDGGTTQSAPVAQVAASASSGGWQRRGGGGGGRGFGGGDAQAKEAYWRAKEERDIAKEGEYAATQKRIEIQAARNAAIETATTMWQFDITPKPKKATEHYDAFLALVEELTDRYLESTKGRFHVDTESQARVEARTGTGGAAETVSSSEAVNQANWD